MPHSPYNQASFDYTDVSDRLTRDAGRGTRDAVDLVTRPINASDRAVQIREKDEWDDLPSRSSTWSTWLKKR